MSESPFEIITREEIRPFCRQCGEQCSSQTYSECCNEPVDMRLTEVQVKRYLG
jgi:hypothetical protein